MNRSFARHNTIVRSLTSKNIYQQKRFVIDFYKKRGLSLSEKWFKPEENLENKEYFEYWRLGPRVATTDPYGYPTGMAKEYIDWEHYRKVFNEFTKHLRFVIPTLAFFYSYLYFRLTEDVEWCEQAVDLAPDVDKRDTIIKAIERYRPNFGKEIAAREAARHVGDAGDRREEKMDEMIARAKAEYEKGHSLQHLTS